MKELIVNTKPKSPISESYRSIRTNIQFANLDKNLQTIMVTSPTAREGKTTTLSNVALAMADADHRVLIVDCDMRKPRIHKVFEISNTYGMAEILLHGGDYKKALNPTSNENLHIITAGKIPSNPSELLYSNAMKNLIQNLKKDFEYIFIDAPPVVPVTDAAIMSNYVDGVILVCASGVIEIELAQKAKESLENVNANILGVVLNKINIKNDKYSSYYYYYGEEDKK